MKNYINSKIKPSCMVENNSYQTIEKLGLKDMDWTIKVPIYIMWFFIVVWFLAFIIGFIEGLLLSI